MVLKNPSSATVNFSPLRKNQILYFWRKSRQRVLTDGITKREIRQWDILEEKYGKSGLHSSESLTRMRSVLPPPLCMRAEFGRIVDIRSRFSIIAIYDLTGMPVEKPAGLKWKEFWMYCVVRQLTELDGICTYPDIAHAMWPPETDMLPSSDIIKVYTTVINKKIAPQHIEAIKGRGLRLVFPAPAAEIRAAA